MENNTPLVLNLKELLIKQKQLLVELEEQERHMREYLDLSGIPPKNTGKKKDTHYIVKTLVYPVWMSAANAYRLYPDDKHTFAEYWNNNKDYLISLYNDLL